ncbi:threonine-phosphate decarboxylase [Neorhizobium sp. P12A]|uniref:threonine-phosphate decarboxylase CobD n=1 Tax=Neorhizobium sp. P12A TaxID=2268027 RepID=UPI0011ED91BA|nr:threonine-phosphate decarboxylase CobD [Neorhizobium sp. P12A]KAA0700171.1 threonine-phosphate decarboxylase [Neorhizobium sp. P12A]
MSGRILHGGGITAAARLFGGKPEDWLDLSTGINPNPIVLPEIPVSAWHRLPDQYLTERARKAAGDYYRSGDILPLPVPGTQSVIQLLPRLAGRVGRVAILSPTYGEYAKAFEAAGFEIDRICDLDVVGGEHSIVVVVNPNNPDGRVIGVERLRKMHDRLAARDGFLIVDEAFGDMRPEASLAPVSASMPNLVIFRSFGKFFGLAGLRLGFVIAKASLLDCFEDWLGPWAVSGPALSLAASLLTEDTTSIRARIAERRNALQEVLSGAGLTVAGGTELFALVADGQASDIYSHLGRHHILVRKFDYAADWLRFGLCPDEDADIRLAEALADFKT